MLLARVLLCQVVCLGECWYVVATRFSTTVEVTKEWTAFHLFPVVLNQLM